MKFSWSVTSTRWGIDQPIDNIERSTRQLRRAKWFAYARSRLDLLSVREIADWCCRDPNKLDRNQTRETQFVQDFEDAVIRGEFGPPAKPQVAYLPQSLPIYRPFIMRAFAGHIGFFRAYGSPIGQDCWVSRDLWGAWFRQRPWLVAPPWLSSASARPEQLRGRLSKPVTDGGAARSPVCGATVEQEWQAWVASLGDPPTRDEANTWAKEHHYSTTQVRSLHQALENPRGRRPKKR